MKTLLVFAVIFLAFPLVIACNDDEDAAAEIELLLDLAQESSFSIEYELIDTRADRSVRETYVRLAALPTRILLEVQGAETEGRVFFANDRAAADTGVFCWVTTLESGETVCGVTQDETGLGEPLLLAFYIPGLALLELSGESDVSITKIGDREIAGTEASCYRFASNNTDSGLSPDAATIGCFGSQGEPLYQQSQYAGDTVEITATRLADSVTQSDVEIPYRVVALEED